MAEALLDSLVSECLDLNGIARRILEKETVNGDVGHPGGRSGDFNGWLVLEMLVPCSDIFDHDGDQGA